MVNLVDLLVPSGTIIIISFAIRQFQMKSTKPSSDTMILCSYRDEGIVNIPVGRAAVAATVHRGDRSPYG